ncbi:MAG: hypothetical protein IMZ52_04445 [Actinobacteria bacterium]|nr:hypothetical protein [Actinomycetota bacterium]
MHELNHFTNELDTEYITIWSIKPIGFINYSLGVTGFKTILYDVIFNFVTVDETNGSIEVWKENSTYTGYMTFDVAIANNREPMNTGGIYKIFYVYNAFQFYEFYDIVYYEKIETGRVD